MNAPRFHQLFFWEWRQAGRSPLLWLVMLVLSACFICGAVNTAALHNAQSEALVRAEAADAAFHAQTVKSSRDYRAPAADEADKVAYWQDPTDVAGYSEYFVRKTASKPHFSLSPLSAGISDLAPTRLEIKLNTPFGFIDTYDFENPRGLALGRFDLAFAITFLLPAGLFLLLGLLATFERDRDMLRLIAAQATGPRIWITARVLAIVAWVAPITAVAIVGALVIAGVPVIRVAGELVVVVVTITLYIFFWSGLAMIVLARQPGAGSALGSFAAFWALLTIGLPLAMSTLVRIIDPAPSAIGFVDAQRQVGDEIQDSRDDILRAALTRREDLRGFVDRISGFDHATRLSFLVPETERRLSPLRTSIDNHRARQEKITGIAGFLIPSLGMEGTLATLAGTDPARQQSFETQARTYQQTLRNIVHPLVQREIARPAPPTQRDTRGKLNLLEPPALPAFDLTETTLSARLRQANVFAAWLLLLALAAFALGLWRTRRWEIVER